MDNFTKYHFRDSDILFTDGRLKSDEYKKYGLHRYDVRHDVEEGDPDTIEESVFVNHFGSILSQDKLDLNISAWGDKPYIQLRGDEIYTFYREGERVDSLESYVEQLDFTPVNIYLGLPEITIGEETFTVRHFNRLSFDSELPNTAYIVNRWVLPMRGTLKDRIGLVLLPGIYSHHEEVLLVVPPGNTAEYSLVNMRDASS